MDDEQALIACERRRCDALLTRDREALERLLDDGLAHIHSTGVRHDKRELIAFVTEVLEYLSIERSGLQARVYGDCGVLTGVMTNEMRRSDNPEPITARALVTEVWLRDGADWRLVSFQATRAA